MISVDMTRIHLVVIVLALLAENIKLPTDPLGSFTSTELSLANVPQQFTQ